MPTDIARGGKRSVLTLALALLLLHCAGDELGRADTSAAISGRPGGAGTGAPVAAAGRVASSAGMLAPAAGMRANAGGAGAGAGAGAGQSGADAGHAGTAAAGSSGAAGSGSACSSGMHASPWKVMLLGDSITAATCYPQLLSKALIAGGHTGFTFVGTQLNNQACNATQVMEEGHGGYGVTYLPQKSARQSCQKPACGSFAELQAWAAEAPEIVLMHYGTNDVWDGQPTSSILAAYAAVMAEFRKQNPAVIFFVSKIIKLNPMGCANCLRDVAALAAALTDDWAAANTTPTSPVWIVDDYGSGFDPDNRSDTSDGVHPTPAGSQKMADATLDSVVAKRCF